MSSVTKHYSDEVCEADSTAEKIAHFWAQGAQTFSDQTRLLTGLPKVDLIPAVERYFEFLQRTVDMNRAFTLRWVKAASMLSGVLREQAEPAGDTVRQQAARKQADAEQAARKQADAEQAARKQADAEQAREADRVERKQSKQAHEKARERYAGLTKGELSDLLAKRQLTKSGNRSELIERLVKSDGK